MRNDSLVSIIVPIYNSKEYIRAAVDSMLNQTYENLEVILVDDGSTDGSEGICDEYREKDHRVVVIHQKNQGQAAARNAAYQIARGEYIVYADSDDLMHREQIRYMLQIQEATGVDIVHVENKKFWDAGRIVDELEAGVGEPDYTVYTAEQALELLCYQKKFSFGPWCKLIKRELLADLKFPVNMGYEDAAIMYKLYGKAKKLAYSETVLYWYRQHTASTMHTGFSDKKIDRIRIMAELRDYLNRNYPALAPAGETRYCLAQLQLLMELPFGKEYRDIKKQAYRNIKDSRKAVLANKQAPARIRGMVASSYLGPDILMLLGRLYMVVTRR